MVDALPSVEYRSACEFLCSTGYSLLISGGIGVSCRVICSRMLVLSLLCHLSRDTNNYTYCSSGAPG
jgi:hypothetical protein